MNDTLFTPINTSFDKQQNPLQSIELPCDVEYKQVNLGAAAYFLLLDYPSDVKIYVGLNSNRDSAFLVDNRNTGFKINDVYTPQGLVSMTKNVYLWTEGITRLQNPDGTPYKIRIAISALAQFEILNNSSINSIESIGQIGRIDGLVGYPRTALTFCGQVNPQKVGTCTGYRGGYTVNTGYLFENMQNKKINISNIYSPNKNYILMAKSVLDPEMTSPSISSNDITINGVKRRFSPGLSTHFHLGVHFNKTPKDFPIIPPNNLFSLCACSYLSAFTYFLNDSSPSPYLAMAQGNSLEQNSSYQFSGQFLFDNFLDEDLNLTIEADIDQINNATFEGDAPANTTNTKASFQFAIFEV